MTTFFAAFAAIFIMFYVSHGIADYWVQTDWQAQNKSKNAKALWTHAATYTATFIPAVIAITMILGLPFWTPIVILAAIGIPHALVDNRKLITWFCAKTKGWRPDNKVVVGDELRDLNPWEIAIRLHVTIALDQKLHYLCLAILAAILAL